MPDTPTPSLANCPFCGGTASLGWMRQKNDQGEFETASYRCGESACEVGPSTWQFLTEEEARAAWNTRAPDPAVKALVEAIKFERHIRNCRDEDEMNFAASGLRYSGAQLADAIQETDRARAAVR